jgi:hypothetical protein
MGLDLAWDLVHQLAMRPAFALSLRRPSFRRLSVRASLRLSGLRLSASLSQRLSGLRHVASAFSQLFGQQPGASGLLPLSFLRYCAWGS